MRVGRSEKAKVVDRSAIPARLNICGEILDGTIDRGYGSHVAFVWGSGAITYGALRDQVVRLAGGLFKQGISRGVPVLVRLPNCIEFALTFLALTRLGAIPVLQNSQLGQEEVDYVLEHSQAKAGISLAATAAPLLHYSNPLDIFVWRGAQEDALSLDSLLDGDADLVDPADTASDEPAFMVYTSGTTGRPKGIVHAHRWVLALGEANRYRVPPEVGDIALATGEWSFISALGHNVVFPLLNGITGAILEDRPQPERILSAIQTHRVTLLYSVATVYRRILAIEGVEDRFDLSSLRGCSATGEALEAATWEQFKHRIGCDIWEHYGVSEMQMVLGQGPRHPVRPGSIGRPLPTTSVAVCNESYDELPAGEIGHLLIAADSPGFFLGYHRDEAMTRQVVHDGWYHTGDLAWRDVNGYLWIVGREDDCFKSRGIFISPYEIEDALRRHPAVVEVCVVPRLDAEIGNRIRAVVVARDGDTPDTDLCEQILSSLRARIAPFKVPHIIEIVDSLPKSPVGKVLRRKVAKLEAR